MIDNSKNAKHRQISLTGTDHYNSELSKVWEKTITQVFDIWKNLQENHKKIYISGIFWTDFDNCFFYVHM